MSGAEWADVERALAAALERPAEERDAYLVGLAPAVRAEVESLLDAHGHAGGFLERPQTDPHAPADELELAAGVTLGPYRIAALLAQGGMGDVYQAFDTKLNRPVAIKVLSGDVADSAARRRFQREAQIASSLNHPHILTVYDVGELDGRQYLVTEFVDGGTLNDRARASRRPWRSVVELLVGVADGLATAHAAGVLHCDIKPENILVSTNGYAKLADFGLAKLAEGSRKQDGSRGVLEWRTWQGAIFGTIAYMSPEQASGKPLDSRSDIFSFGVVLYELFAGKRPFRGPTDLEVLQTVIHGAPEPL